MDNDQRRRWPEVFKVPEDVASISLVAPLHLVDVMSGGLQQDGQRPAAQASTPAINKYGSPGSMCCHSVDHSCKTATGEFQCPHPSFLGSDLLMDGAYDDAFPIGEQ